MCSVTSHRRHQRHGCSTRTNDDYSLTCIVEVFWPLLWVHDRTDKAFSPCELGIVTTFVAVVTTAHEQKIAGEVLNRARLHILGRQRPRRRRRRPFGFLHLLTKTNVAINAELSRSFLHVLENCGTISNGLIGNPRLERISEGVHVAIGTHTWIAKQIPGTAYRVTALKNQITAIRAHRLQVPAGTDTRKPGTYDDDVHVGRPMHTAGSVDMLHAFIERVRGLRPVQGRALLAPRHHQWTRGC